jgi:hypothetical protein
MVHIFRVCTLFFIALASAEESCTCGKYLGTFCSSRADNQSDAALLMGNCEEDAVYTCSEMFGNAQVKYYCTDCKQSTSIGQDGCGLG